MYSMLVYKEWHTIVMDLHASSLLFKEIYNWCTLNLGHVNPSDPTHIWNWGSNYGYSLWFAFKNKEDCAQFILTWSEHVKIL